MKSEEIKALFTQFESAASELEGVECWSARELQDLLGYSKWENFEKVIQKAKDACRNAGEEIEYHFPDVRKMVKIGSEAEKEHIDNNLAVRDMLTKRGIVPQNLPAAEDVKKLQRKLEGDEKKVLKGTKKKK